MFNDSWYVKHGVEPPEHIDHQTDISDISKVVKPLNARNWRAEGNILIADTDMGPLRQRIPTSHIFTGPDSEGLPTFRKIDI